MTDCIIFSGGEMENLDIVDTALLDKCFIICADSGVVYAQRLGVKPNLVVGDYDSLGCKPSVDCEIITYPVEKDDTDLMIAAREAVKRGYKSVMIYGALGGRLDHTIGNIQTLNFLLSNGVIGTIVSENEICTIFGAGTHFVPRKKDFSLSLVSYSDKVEGLSINGVKYSLENVDIDNTFPVGISNKITSDVAEISFKKGNLLVIQSRLITLF